MNTAVRRLPDASSRRLQVALALLVLGVAVVATVLLVATPVSSRTAARTGAGKPVLPHGLRVEITGGEPVAAHSLADRLAAAGATIGAISAALDPNSLETATAVVYYDRRDARAAAHVRRLLGRGTIRREQVFQPSVDVTIVLGKDQ